MEAVTLLWARGPARVVGDPIKGEGVLDEERAVQHYMLASNDLSSSVSKRRILRETTGFGDWECASEELLGLADNLEQLLY
jgi:hypothetical protein